jgi:hypothetical protein
MKDQDDKMYEYAGWMAKYGGLAKDMTMRDHFAGLAMQSLVAYPDDQQNMTYAEMAEWAYAMADAMLKAREK